MADFRIDTALAEAAVASRRFEMLSKLELDIATIRTWDVGLSRRTRILVPVDVQAYVVPAGGAELTVDILGDPKTDPPPFSDGSVRKTGVHLHWAMPDALLTAARADQATRTPELPILPDQWAVVRTLQPNGQRQVLATAWVIDARSQVVTPLPAYLGASTTAPEGSVERLDGFALGAHWTSSYTACAGRFAFHDPLTDLAQLREVATAGFDGDQAVYTVAGWWSDPAQDPLHGARGMSGLDAVLAGLRWDIDHDLRDAYTDEPDTREIRMQAESGLDRPTSHPVTEIYGSDGRRVQGVEGTDLASGTPFATSFQIAHGDALPSYDALLHGSVLGVPVGDLPPTDDRPEATALTVAAGSDIDDVIAAMGAGGVDIGDDRRRAAEDLLAAFSHGLVAELGTPDGLDHLGDREHESGFWSFTGAALPGMKPDVLQDQVGQGADPLTVGRHGRAGISRNQDGLKFSVPRISWTHKLELLDAAPSGTAKEGASQNVKVTDVADDGVPPSPLRQVIKAPPRYFRPAPLIVALRGAKPSHRHHGDGLFTSDGTLLCRYPRAAVPRYKGLLDGSQVLPTLGSGAVPAEVLTVVREAVLLNPYGRDWLVTAAGPAAGEQNAVKNRLDAEMVRMFGVEGRYDGSSHVAMAEPKAPSSWNGVSLHRQNLELQVAGLMAEAAITEGQPPSPVAITTWRQPWVPIWLEWRVTVTGTTTLRGWELVGHDLEPVTGAETEPVLTRTLVGRGLAGQGVGETLRAAVRAWLDAEGQRQATLGRSAYGDGSAVQRLADFDHPLDLLSASLDGLREQLLGIDFVGSVARVDGKPVASALPVPLFGGTVHVDALRVVDAFGRYVDVADDVLDELRTTLELEVEGEGRALRLRPRIQNLARWLWRLVDPGQDRRTEPHLVKEAFVDQVAPDAAVNPVSGFLLPDHIDEALEAFTVAGSPIGQVLHDPITNAVNWECAPGRPLPPDAGPLVGIAAQERLVAEIAAGLVRADAAARALPEPPADTALTAFLRAVDSTLWTVDTYASLGDTSLAGLVGRPIAVVRTMLSLDAPDDVGELTLAAGLTGAARKAAFDALEKDSFEVQIGTLGRADDSLLGFFVDDDYEKFFMVDKVVAELARLRPTGRHRGHLGVHGATTAEEPVPLDHPYLSAENRTFLRRGQTTMLTLLMIPGGRVHLTSGVLPRKELALAEAWFGPGTKKLMPSLRVGPLLVDPGEIRLPLVSILGENQTFTRRTGELTWKDDPILAATQTAYLPRLPHEVQEGWIRVTPTEPGQEGPA